MFANLAERLAAAVLELAAELGLRWPMEDLLGPRLGRCRELTPEARLSGAAGTTWSRGRRPGGEWEAREADDWKPDSWPADFSRVLLHWLAGLLEVELASSEMWSGVRLACQRGADKGSAWKVASNPAPLLQEGESGGREREIKPR